MREEHRLYKCEADNQLEMARKRIRELENENEAAAVTEMPEQTEGTEWQKQK